MANGQLDMNQLLQLLMQQQQQGAGSQAAGQAGVMQTTPGQTGQPDIMGLLQSGVGGGDQSTRLLPGGHLGVMPRGGGVEGLLGQPGMNQDQIQQLYHMVSQGNQPQQAATGYANYLGQQERIAAQQGFLQNPMERFLRMYGNINPADYTTESLAKFEAEIQRGGMPKISLLDRRDDLRNPEITMLNEAIATSQDLERRQFEALQLASRFDNFPADALRGQLAGGLSEWFKGQLGLEDKDVTQLLTDYRRVVNGLVLADLPPGVASDTDIMLARRGYPGEYADPEVIASYLRGVAKAQAIERAQARHRAEYLSSRRATGEMGSEGLLQDWELRKGDYVQREIDAVGGWNTADPYQYFNQRQQALNPQQPPPVRAPTGLPGPGDRPGDRVTPGAGDAVQRAQDRYKVDLSF